MGPTISIRQDRIRPGAPRLRRALRDARDVLARSFHDQPHFVDLLPDADRRRRVLPHVFAALLADAVEHGRVHTAVERDRTVGAAVWYPPRTYPLSTGRSIRTAPELVRIAAIAPRSLRRLMQFQATAGAFLPVQPYWYLAAIGVDPTHQGEGVGTRLLTSGLDVVDADGQRSYLETHTPRAVEWYRSHGFRVRTSEVPFAPGGPPNWTMLRPEGTP